MGFLSRLFSDINGPDDTQLAMIDAVTLAILADGQVTDLEEGYVEGFISEMCGVDEELAEEYADESRERIEEEGVEGVLERIAEEVDDQDDRERLFQAAAFVQFADGTFREGSEVLAMLADALSLSPEQIHTLLGETRTDFESISDFGGASFVDDYYEPEDDDFFAGEDVGEEPDLEEDEL